MTDTHVLEIAMSTITVAAKLAAPILLTALVIGLGVSLMQSVTQVQEFTLTFVPKLAGIAIVLMLSGSWMMRELVNFTRELFGMIPGLISG